MSYLDSGDGGEVMQLTDEELLGLSRTKPALFEQLVDRYQEPFMRKARKIVRTEEEAEDVVQEAFTKIYFNAAKYSPQDGARFSSWAYTILINVACTRYQKLKRERGVRIDFDPEVFEMVPDIEERLLERHTMKDLVSRTLARMPHLMARTLETHFIQDRPQKEIADAEGVSIAVIKTRVLRAKAAFKKAHQPL